MEKKKEKIFPPFTKVLPNSEIQKVMKKIEKQGGVGRGGD